MVGLGQKERIIMYILVNSKQVKPYEKECLAILHQAQQKLRKSEKLTFQITMVGSGAHKIVTKNGENGAFDLDFNLILHRVPSKLVHDLPLLKRTIRQAIDQFIPNNYSHGKDSTSVITYVKQNNQVNFHFDIGLIKAEKKDQRYRLVYENNAKNMMTWNQVFNTEKLTQKAQLIRKHNAFHQVRQRYVELKNQALSDQNEISSYSLYAQAINDVFQNFKSMED